MASSGPDPMRGDALTNKWNGFAAAYGDVMEQWSWPAYVSLVSAAGLPVLAGKAPEGVSPVPDDESATRESGAAGLVLDIGCGPGSHSVELARAFPSLRILATDLAPEMIKRAQAAAHAPTNVQFAVASADDAETAEHGIQAVVRADLREGEAPFIPPDSPGACAAIANLVMQIVPDTGAALRGLAASLRPGAPLCFSVWGQKARSPLFTLLPSALAACELPALAGVKSEVAESKASVRSGFHLGGDDASLRALVESHGFTGVSTWSMELPMPGGPVRSAADGAARLMRLVPANTGLVDDVRAAAGEEGVAELRARAERLVAGLMEEGRALGLHVVMVSCRRAV